MSGILYAQSGNLRLHIRTPRIDAVTHSIPIMLRDAILDRVKRLPFFSSFLKFSTNKMLQIQPEQLPFCGVYFLQEIGAPDGDPQAGEPRFRTTVRIGFSVIIQNNDPEAAEYKLDDAFQVLAHGLLNDHTLYNNKQFKVQSYNGTSRQHIFGSVGQNNEMPIAELRWELICDLGVITYPPQIVDDLDLIHFKTAYPGPDREDVQQTTAEWDMEQDDEY